MSYPNPAVSINWRASLVPAAAVIPAPVAYTNIAAVKKLVVDRGAGAPGRRAGLGGCRAHAARIPRTRRARLTGGTAAAGGGLPLLRPPDGSPCPRSPQAEPILPCVVRTAGGTRAARAAASPRPPAVPSWATPARSARPASPPLRGRGSGACALPGSVRGRHREQNSMSKVADASAAWESVV